jgi:hypothetical protein
MLGEAASSEILDEDDTAKAEGVEEPIEVVDLSDVSCEVKNTDLQIRFVFVHKYDLYLVTNPICQVKESELQCSASEAGSEGTPSEKENINIIDNGPVSLQVGGST